MNMKYLFLGIAVLLVMILGTIMFFANTHADQVAEIIKKRETFQPIAYKRLSSEKEFPFLRFGKTLSERRKYPPAANFRKYEQAVQRWPDVRSCLIISERTKETPNLLLFDWQQVRSTYQAEVCLFRVMSSLADVEKARQWFLAQGFDRVLKARTPLNKRDNKEEVFSAYWNMRTKASPIGYDSIWQVIEKLPIPLKAYDVNIGVRFHSKEVTNVGATYSRL